MGVTDSRTSGSTGKPSPRCIAGLGDPGGRTEESHSQQKCPKSVAD